MKKMIMLGAAVAMLSVTACKKDYTCTCDVSTGEVVLEYKKVKKADAEDGCADAETTYKIVDSSASCSL